MSVIQSRTLRDVNFFKPARRRFLRSIIEAGVRGAKDCWLINTDRSPANIGVVKSLIEDGFVEAHVSYLGDGTVFDTVYVATRKGREARL